MLHALFALALTVTPPAPLPLTYLPAPARGVNHGAGLVALADGDLLACWYSGPSEADPDVAILCSRQGATGWSAPRVAVRPRFAPDVKSLGNVALTRDRDGRVVMIFGIVRSRRILGLETCRSWRCGRIEASVSHDGGGAWSPPLRLDDRGGALPRARPLRDARFGDLVPVYLEGRGASVLATDLSAMTASGFGPIRDMPIPGRRLIQPALTVGRNGVVWAYLRDLRKKRIHAARLDAGAVSWSPAAATNLENPSSAVEAFTDARGAIVLIYNPSRRNRRTLALARSMNGLTFERGCDLVARNAAGDVAYPAIAERGLGAWSVVFSTSGKRRIAEARFDQAWLDACFRR